MICVCWLCSKFLRDRFRREEPREENRNRDRERELWIDNWYIDERQWERKRKRWKRKEKRMWIWVCVSCMWVLASVIESVCEWDCLFTCVCAGLFEMNEHCQHMQWCHESRYKERNNGNVSYSIVSKAEMYFTVGLFHIIKITEYF